MFTGLISDCGRIRKVAPSADGSGRRMVIETAWDTARIATGASIACSGVCLTAVELGSGWFAVDVSRETLDCTTLGAWREGTRVNLERSLTAGDELGGHLVSGHVDGVGEVTAHTREGDSWRTTIAVPPRLMALIAPKGSIAVDGVSLTVNEVGSASFGVNIIPHTAAVTTFGALAAGDRVNLEIDMLARYVARLVEAQWTTRRI
ncbi:riboflavin synthase alpha chain [Limimonas halophila]|uniref:Riboflavin synthase n=1 Tax=Limimonas halophila TaxID=1082479 RepID=A0A1G7NVS7_9PROT|nr:riboflavin synthase [Limimonas halophila]SDF78114.1 riboflavin synthase alpha chain [Limimonas halophila]